VTIDPVRRPTAQELIDFHPWIVDFREALKNFEDDEMEWGPEVDVPSEGYENATAARTTAIMHEKEDMLYESPLPSPIPSEDATPDERDYDAI